jgi:hypothetical protein
MNFITCNLLGPSATHRGLGNQLFGVAAALSHAKDNNKIAYFPCLQDKNKYGNFSENIFRNLNIQFPPNSIQNIYREKDFRYSEIPNLSNLLIEGYFQSEKYFCNNKNLIRETINLPENMEKYLQNKYSTLLWMDNTVSVHIRRGDYLTNFKGCFEILELDYYKCAFSFFDKNSTFVFFGENLEDFSYFKDKFKEYRCFFVHEQEEVLDLFLMSKMKNNIIANSSFSWWAAWLNTNKNKKVISPQKWFGKENPTFQDSDKITIDLIPSDWERI